MPGLPELFCNTHQNATHAWPHSTLRRNPAGRAGARLEDGADPGGQVLVVDVLARELLQERVERVLQRHRQPAFAALSLLLLGLDLGGVFKTILKLF